MLLVLVVAVCGTIAYKIVSALNPELPEIQAQEFTVNSNYKIETQVDTFSITKANRDPFLGIVRKQSNKVKVKKKNVQWKPVIYHGFVKKGNNKMFIVSIKNKQHLLKKGQIKDSITLVNGNSKFITMRYKNSTQTFTLKQK